MCDLQHGCSTFRVVKVANAFRFLHCQPLPHIAAGGYIERWCIPCELLVGLLCAPLRDLTEGAFRFLCLYLFVLTVQLNSVGGVQLKCDGTR